MWDEKQENVRHDLRDVKFPDIDMIVLNYFLRQVRRYNEQFLRAILSVCDKFQFTLHERCFNKIPKYIFNQCNSVILFTVEINYIKI